MSNPFNKDMSRRGFLSSISTGSLVLMARVSQAEDDVAVAVVEEGSVPTFDPDLFVSIARDGVVTITAHRSEMGTGIRTGLPRVVADELEADWSKVVIEQAVGDKRLGSQNTDGSNSVRHFFQRMRVAGATARTMLEQAAAEIWNVEPTECHGRNHRVVHAESGKSLGYGDLVEAASKLDIPASDTLLMKPAS